MPTLTPDQIEAERQRLLRLLMEVQTASKLYAKNPAMMAVIAGRSRQLRDRLYDLEHFGTIGPRQHPQ